MKQNLLNPRKIFSLLAFSAGFSGLSFSQAIVRDTLFFTGAEQNYTVPCGVTNLTIDAFGGKGANGTNNPNNGPGGVGGLGGHVQGTLSVTPNQSFSVFVGGQGINATSGYNGGGNGGINVGGGGGGATDIRLGGNTLTDRILVAGGGGGGGAAGCEANDVNGGAGGAGGGGNGGNGAGAFTEAQPTFNPPLPEGFAGGGFGGNGMTGGNFGIGCNGFNGTVGTNAINAIGGDGGSASNCCCFNSFAIPGGGGGGGGYEGGGGGGGGSVGTLNCNGSLKGGGGGGAGGTNFVGSAFTNPVTANGVNNGNGYVVFSYENPIPSTPETTSFATSFCAGNIISYDVTPIPNATSYTWAATGDLNIISGQGTDSITVTGFGNNGTISVVAENSCGTSEPSTPITVTINQNPVLTIVEGDFSVCPGEQVTLEASGADTYSWTGGIENATAFTPTSTQTYIVTGTNTATGCSSDLSQVVTLNAAPMPTITSNVPNPICVGTAYNLTGTPIGGTFSVQSGDPSALVGNVFNAGDFGSWVLAYTVTNSDGCSGVNTVSFTIDCVVGLNQLSLENVLTIYPNPTTGQFKITSELNEGGELQIFNQAGQLVYKKSLENLKENNIDVKDLTPGYYNLQVNSSSKKYLGKLNVIK